MHSFALDICNSLYYNYNCIEYAIELSRGTIMTKRSWTGDKALQIAKAILNGELTPTMDRLTPVRILEIANAAVTSKGYAEYADFADELFIEIMGGRPPYELGWRLNEPRNVLRANLWTVEGRPAKFYPPQH